jgi:phasin family protein
MGGRNGRYKRLSPPDFAFFSHCGLDLGYLRPILIFVQCNIYCSPFNLLGEIMTLTPEQIAAANKANLETLLNLTNKAFEGVEKLVELNMAVAKTAMTENVQNAKQALSVRDAQQLIAMQAGMVQPLAEKIMSYSRHLYNIANETQTTFTSVAESQLKKSSGNMNGMVEELSKNAPAGSEATIQAIKQAMAAANNAYETTQKSIKQAVDLAQNNFNAAANTAVKAARGKK